MSVEVPERSAVQRMASLARANEIRVARAEMKRTMTREGAVGLLEEPPWWLESMKVELFLCAIPKMGVVKARALLNSCRVSHSKTVGGLSGRQRDEVIRAL